MIIQLNVVITLGEDFEYIGKQLSIWMLESYLLGMHRLDSHMNDDDFD